MRFRNDDHGLAMVWVVMIGAFVAAVAVVMVARAFQNSRDQLTERRADVALVVADTGLNNGMAILFDDPDFFNVPAGPGAFADDQAEKAWVIKQVDDMETLGTLDLQLTEEGEYAIVRPDSEEVLYSVGWVPSRGDADASLRVLKMSFDPEQDETYVFLPDVGISSNGDIDLGGRGVFGIKGGAHANGDLTKRNDKTKVEGCTSAGGINQFPNKCEDDGEVKEIPPVNPLDFHQMATHDLCDEGPFGVVRMGPAFDGPGTKAEKAQPCTGDVVGAPPSVGWSKTGFLWQYNGGTTAGVFYINGGSAVVGADSPADGLTVVVAASDNTECAEKHGDFTVNGNIQMIPHVSAKDLAVVLDRDFVFSGTADIFGIILVGEHFDIGGNPGANNAVVSSGTCDTPSSPVSVNALRGAGSITYNGGLEAPIYGGVTATGLVIVERWEEL